MSAKQKPITPYERLKAAFLKYVSSVEYPHTKLMWSYPKAKLSDGWSLIDLAERVSAAEQLGYDVVLRSDDGGLKVLYRKKHAETPWELR